MSEFQVDTPHIPNEKGCRLIWHHDDDEKIIYISQKRRPKSRRNLKDLIHVV